MSKLCDAFVQEGLSMSKATAIDIMMADPDPLARILHEKEGRKYYEVTAYTPYAGEEMVGYISCHKSQTPQAYATDLMYECGSEWIDQHLDTWQEDGYESREDAQEDYWSGCGVRIQEISAAEYGKYNQGEWIMSPV